MRHYLSVAAALFAGALFTANIGFAADRTNGRDLSNMCSACHGAAGIAKDPEVPNIAGDSALYIEKSLMDYKTGMRQDRRMTLIAESLTRKEIKDLAEWYSSIKITAELPDE